MLTSQITDYNPKVKDLKAENIKFRQLIHTYYKAAKYNDYLGIKERVVLKNGSVLPNYRVIENPVRSYYVTKKKVRLHRYKKEYEYLKNLEEIKCYQHDLVTSVRDTLGLKSAYLSPLLNNSYLYKADISMEALVKMSYLAEFSKDPTNEFVPLSIGFLDIEIDINHPDINSTQNNINIMSLSIDNKIYTTFLKSRMYQITSDGESIPFTLEELKKKSTEFYKDDIEKYNFEFNYFPANSVLDMLKYIFKIIHASHVDFVGIWHMNFDVPFIMREIKKYGYNIKDFFCPGYLKNKECNYYTGSDYISHYSLKWPWVYQTSGTCFVDSLGLFSNLRKTSRFEDSYKLDNILSNYVDKNKVLQLDTEGHKYYAKNKYMDYIIYNQFDVMGLHILEQKNSDITNMYLGGLTTPFQNFDKATKLVTNDHFYYYQKKGIIISSAGHNQITENELISAYYKKKFNTIVTPANAIPKVGGAVLRPERCTQVSVNIFSDTEKIHVPYTIRRLNYEAEEYEDFDIFDNPEKAKNITSNKFTYSDYDTISAQDTSMVSMFVSDVDLTSSYPSVTIVYNIARSTISKFVFLIENTKTKKMINPFKIYELFIAMKENANTLIKTLYKGITYSDLEKYLDR